ncbi:c-myc promoter binding protein [Anaeramoeba flamelloides]|uniref:C-myc promoter binding protein n=1 Tax=Anaeramoeba flamelloides TaxID=1746091 RepID=A0ABQ8X640_9EUKA|nr:c-myc promoter binding protein [Anaeramoeba flamelloides]
MNFVYDIILISGIGDDIVALEPERDLRMIQDELETYSGTTTTMLSSQNVGSTEKYFAMELEFEPTIISLSCADSKKELPDQLLKFIHPEEGIRLTASERKPTSHSFVLTTLKGDLMYGFSLKKSVPFSKQKRESLIELVSKHKRIRGTEGLPDTLFSERTLTIISKSNYSNTFLTILAYFVRSEPTKIQLNDSSPSRLSSILSKIVPPQIGISPPKIRFNAYTSIKFPELAYPNELPYVDIIVISKDYQKIADCTEAILSLIYPFSYPYIYIPILPLSLLPIFEAPVTFLIGCHASILEVEIPPDDVVIIDLDHNFITANDPIIALPKNLSAKLLKGIQKNCNIFQKPKKMGRSFLILENNPIILQNPLPKFKNTSFSSSESSNTENSRNFNIDLVSEEVNSRINLENFFNKTKNTNQNKNKNKNKNKNTNKKINKIERKKNTILKNKILNLKLKKEEIFNLTKIRLLFLDFIVDLIERYYPFIIIPNANNNRDFDCFDVDGYLNQVKEENLPFLQAFTSSQMFIYFIEGKLSRGLNEQSIFDLKMRKKMNSYFDKYSITNYKSQSGLLDLSTNNDSNWSQVWIEVINQQLSISHKQNQQKQSKKQTTTFIDLGVKGVNIHIPKKLNNPPTNFYFILQIKDQLLCLCAKTLKLRNKWITTLKTQSMDQNYLKKLSQRKKVPKEIRRRFELNSRKNSAKRVNTFRSSWKKNKRLTINLGNLNFRTFQAHKNKNKNMILLKNHLNISPIKKKPKRKQSKSKQNNYSIQKKIVFPIDQNNDKNTEIDQLLHQFQNNLSSPKSVSKEDQRRQNIINKSLLIDSESFSSISIINKKTNNNDNDNDNDDDNDNYDNRKCKNDKIQNQNLTKSKSENTYFFEKKDFKLIDNSFGFSNESTTDFDSSSDVELEI